MLSGAFFLRAAERAGDVLWPLELDRGFRTADELSVAVFLWANISGGWCEMMRHYKLAIMGGKAPGPSNVRSMSMASRILASRRFKVCAVTDEPAAHSKQNSTRTMTAQRWARVKVTEPW